MLRAIKNLRNDLVDRWFRRCAEATGRRLAAELSARGSRNVAFTVAFNAPWVVDLLTAGWARHQPGVPLVVIDNSSAGSARKSHRDLCRRRGIPYLALPWNPEWSPNRSHGLSLNWIWFNVVRHAPLDLVGFIDHDCIPIADFDLREGLREFDAYGLWGASLKHPDAWNIWAGYCFLRPAAATGMTVDFKHRIEYGLDTGGGNWSGFYRRLPASRVGTAAHRTLRIEPGAGRMAADLLLLDESFLHLDGVSYKAAHQDVATRRRLIEMIATGRIAERLVPSPREQ